MIIIFVVLGIFTSVSASIVNDNLVRCIQRHSGNSTSFIWPSTSYYNDSRIGTNFRYNDFYPSLVVNVTEVTDILASVACAKEFKVEITAMNGGHSMEGASCTNNVLLHLDHYNDLISYELNHGNDKNSFVKIQSGVRLARFYGLVTEISNNRTDSDSGIYVISGGTCPDVGVTGHVLCGGYGYLSRFIGMTSDQILEMEVVNAQGELITVSDKANRDLFWALRGSCTSSFGIVVSITFALTYLPYANMTHIELVLPPLNGSYREDVNVTAAAVDFAHWFQSWSAVEVTTRFTSTLNFEKYNNFTFMGLYLGSRAEAIAATAEPLIAALAPLYRREEVLAAYTETSYFEAIVWFTGSSDLQTLDDFLSVTSLPPVDERGGQSRRKVKSVMVTEPVSKEGIEQMLVLRRNRNLTQIEWKPHSGVRDDCSAFDSAALSSRGSTDSARRELYDTTAADAAGAVGPSADDAVSCISRHLYTDGRSPLVRGELYEMNFGNSNDKSKAAPEYDQQLVDSANGVAAYLAPYFTENGNASYAGYIDLDLQHPATPILAH